MILQTGQGWNNLALKWLTGPLSLLTWVKLVLYNVTHFVCMCWYSLNHQIICVCWSENLAVVLSYWNNYCPVRTIMSSVTCRCRWQLACVIFLHEQSMNPDVMQSHPLCTVCRMHFDQQQVSAAVGWLGDGDFYLMLRMHAVRWLAISIQQVEASQIYCLIICNCPPCISAAKHLMHVYDILVPGSFMYTCHRICT